jgi:hypothetical protein
MEARDGPQHRTQVNLRKALRTWVSQPPEATPGIQSWSQGSGDGGGGTLCAPYPGRSLEVRERGRRGGGNDDPPKPREKSDHLIVARKPGNTGGAKGVMS